MKLSQDGWAGLVVAAASLFLFWLTLGLRDNPLVPIGPGYYPRIVLGVSAAFALALVASDLLRRTPPAPRPQKLNYPLVAAMFAVFALYCGALPYLGFRISTLLYVAACNALLDPPKSAKGWLRVVALAVLTTMLVYYVFERWITVLLPRGRWTGF